MTCQFNAGDRFKIVIDGKFSAKCEQTASTGGDFHFGLTDQHSWQDGLYRISLDSQAFGATLEYPLRIDIGYRFSNKNEIELSQFLVSVKFDKKKDWKNLFTNFENINTRVNLNSGYECKQEIKIVQNCRFEQCGACSMTVKFKKIYFKPLENKNPNIWYGCHFDKNGTYYTDIFSETGFNWKILIYTAIALAILLVIIILVIILKKFIKK
ncbi:hypothetical protein MXB_2581 [Myxobolus squamalis]|nr:hypothetical protein MXB_2581 [Myxobolus squamalis]